MNKTKTEPQIILGIDPGTATTGWGIISKTNQNLRLVDYGVISTPAKTLLEDRLLTIQKELNRIVKKYRPVLSACEELFFFKNAKTVISVGQARGAIILTLRQNKIPIHHLTPLQIKQAVSSYGRADKQQVQKMVKLILGLKETPEPDDAADGLAAAICLANTL